MILCAVGKVAAVAPGRTRNISSKATGAVLPWPAFDENPRAWPISCVATATKSVAPGLMPSSGLKSNVNSLLKEIVATTVLGSGATKPSTCVKERDIDISDPLPVSVGIADVGNAL